MNQPDLFRCGGCNAMVAGAEFRFVATPANPRILDRTCPHCGSLSARPVKPLWLVLKHEYFDQFEQGVKTLEYRRRSDRFNAQTCPIGRNVVLSRGYGGRRLTGRITGFHYDNLPSKLPGWTECYGKTSGTSAACIRIELDQATKNQGAKPC